MAYIKQLFIILLISFLGELLNLLLPLPIPGAVYGLVLMLLALHFQVIKLHQVEAVGNFLLDIMPLMFIPIAVGMLPIWPQLQQLLLPLFVVSIATTLFVILVTGRISQRLLKTKGGQDHDND